MSTEESENTKLGPYIESLNAKIDLNKTLTISFQARTRVAKSGLKIEKLEESGIKKYIGRQFKIVNFSEHGKNTNPLQEYSYSIKNVNLNDDYNIWVWINEKDVSGGTEVTTPRGTRVKVKSSTGDDIKK